MNAIDRIKKRFEIKKQDDDHRPAGSLTAPTPPRLTSETHVTFCKPWCESCGGWRGVEREYSDGSHAIHCLTCKAELPEVPRERPAKEKNKNRGEEITE